MTTQASTAVSGGGQRVEQGWVDGVPGLGGCTPGARCGKRSCDPSAPSAPFGKPREGPGRAPAGGDTVSARSSRAHRRGGHGRGHGRGHGHRPPRPRAGRQSMRTGAHALGRAGVPAAPGPGRPWGSGGSWRPVPQRGPRVASSDPQEGVAGRRAGRRHLTAPAPARRTPLGTSPPAHQRPSGPAASAARTCGPAASAAATTSELCPGRGRSACRRRRGRRGPGRVAGAARRPGRRAGGPRAMGCSLGGERGRRSRCGQRGVRVLPQPLASAAAPAGLRHRGRGPAARGVLAGGAGLGRIWNVEQP